MFNVDRVFWTIIVKIAGSSVTAIDASSSNPKNDIRKEVIQNNKKQEIALYDEQ